MKCSLCKVNIDSIELNKIGKNIYCDQCYPVKQTEETERRKLIGYICKIFDIKKPTGMMLSQMKNYNSKDKISYKEQRMVLYYLIEIEKMQLESKFGLGIVKYKYGDMLIYKDKIDRERRQREAEIQRNKSINTEEKVITIKPKQKEQSYRDKHMITLDDWGL